MINDDIERYLFGKIDDQGSRAVRAFASSDMAGIHYGFQDFFAYLGAQKLRTPKGLDWIKSMYPSMTQHDLMEEMQALRQMHCTMWYECVREIVSAENSKTKFIVTDHPVTTFNRSYHPGSHPCTYPNDPPIDLLGTQTLFALDANHCLILTNIEYAKDPSRVDARRRRTNARYHGETMAKTDAIIRARAFTDEQVGQVNAVLKSRAKSYIAANSEEWLTAELPTGELWAKVGNLLLPPKDDLWRWGGEIYVGYQDGTTHYQDAFGRTTPPHDHLRKDQRKVLSNDPCGCGSGRKYRHCCEAIQGLDRPTWEYFSARERNLMLVRAISKITKLDQGKSWDDVRRDLGDHEVQEIHNVVEALWPVGTDIAQLLPREDRNVFRATYLGMSDARTALFSFVSWLAYFDEVVIAHPFMNGAFMKPEFSPTKSPRQHRAQTLRNVYFFILLEPFIAAGIIHVIPDLSDFNDYYRRSMWPMAQHRAASGMKADNDKWLVDLLARDESLRSVGRMPRDAIRRLFQRQGDGGDQAMLDQVVDLVISGYEGDPLNLLQPLVPGEENSQFLSMKGFNLESAMFFAHLTGSAYFRPSWTLFQRDRGRCFRRTWTTFQADRGRCFRLIVDDSGVRG